MLRRKAIINELLLAKRNKKKYLPTSNHVKCISQISTSSLSTSSLDLENDGHVTKSQVRQRTLKCSSSPFSSHHNKNKWHPMHSSLAQKAQQFDRVFDARTFSTSKEEKDKPKESLRNTINRLQNDNKYSSSSNKSYNDDKTNEILHDVSSAFSSFSSSLSETWDELINSNQAKDINKKIGTSRPGNAMDDDNEAADKYEGTTAIMTIDESENLNAYERIQKRLSEAPLIQDIFKQADELYEKSGAASAKEKMSHISEDAREAWETSQNPWVYRVSSVYDTITAESETAMAERELRVLDPHFSLEDWKRGLVEVTLPRIMSLFLQGRIKELKPSLGEAIYNRLAAESRARKKEGVYIDTNVLGIMNSEILNCAPDTVNKGSPLITIHFMCQQINCVRKKKTGEIVEGSEDDIRAYSYIVVLQREYDEEKGELNWKIMDFMLNGAIAYL